MVWKGNGATDVETAILAYLAAHPDAADNAVGVQQWWLPRRLVDASLHDVETALAAMTEQGRLTEIRLPDGSVIFAAGHAKERNDG